MNAWYLTAGTCRSFSQRHPQPIGCEKLDSYSKQQAHMIAIRESGGGWTSPFHTAND